MQRRAKRKRRRGERAHESLMERRRERQEQKIKAERLLREAGDQGQGQSRSEFM